MPNTTQFTLILSIVVALATTAGVLMMGQGQTAQTAPRPSAIEIGEAWVAETIGAARNTAAYFKLVNTGASDTLVGATSRIADSADLHATVFDGGVMRMRPVRGIPVPANSETSLEPGGFHLMLMDLAAPLVPGQTVRVVLKFERGDPVILDVPVRSREEMLNPASDDAEGENPEDHSHH